MRWLLWSLLACDAPTLTPPEPEPARLVAPAAQAPPEIPPDTQEQAEALDGADLPEPTDARYAGTHILVAYEGSEGAPADLERDRDEALALARDLRTRALGGEPLEALARRWSDGPSAPRGGRLGTWLRGTYDPAFERAVAAARPGAVGPLIETPWGFHVVRRDPVETFVGEQVWISWSGARVGAVDRSRAEAEARAEQALAALEEGASFDEVAHRWSDASTGDIGPISPDGLAPSIAEAARQLGPGDVSEVVESPWGFHLLRRDG